MGEWLNIGFKSPPDRQKPIPIQVPVSKSLSNRYLLIAALSRMPVDPDMLSAADDTRLLYDALFKKREEKNFHHAGASIRFALAWAAITPGRRILDGSDRLRERPVGPLVDALRAIGADITCLHREGFAPLAVNGKPLQGGDFRLHGSQSSQFLSALLLIAPYLETPSVFHVSENQVSRPYIEMTLNLMRSFGADVGRNGGVIKVSPSKYRHTSYLPEPDWSGAANFYTAAALLPNFTLFIEGLQGNSIQGDRVAARLFENFGVRSRFTDEGVILSSLGRTGRERVFDLVDCPDLAQPFATAACGLQIPVRLNGLQTLRIKETDRIIALASELTKCGASVETGRDYIELKAFLAPEHIPRINTFSDHRMAMAFAPLAAVFGGIYIEDPGVVSKSFPDYWSQLSKLGFNPED